MFFIILVRCPKRRTVSLALSHDGRAENLSDVWVLMVWRVYMYTGFCDFKAQKSMAKPL